MPSSIADRSLTAAFAISLVGHLSVAGFQLLRPHHGARPRPMRPVEIIYEHRAAEQELHRLQQQLASLTNPSASLPGVQAPAPQIRVPDRPIGGMPSFGGMAGGDAGESPGQSSAALGAFSGTAGLGAMLRAPVVDLTNLVEAAQGNPVLLSYFSAIREQIQRTANRKTWNAGQPGDEGLIYVSFVLNQNGDVQVVGVVADRSALSRHLQEIAVQIVKAAGPFPPFPPSIQDPMKTIVVPLEFLLGS